MEVERSEPIIVISGHFSIQIIAHFSIVSLQHFSLGHFL